MNQLTNLEAGRILAVFDDMAEKLHLLSYIPTDERVYTQDQLPVRVAHDLKNLYQAENIHEHTINECTRTLCRTLMCHPKGDNFIRSLKRSPSFLQLLSNFQELRALCQCKLLQNKDRVELEKERVRDITTRLGEAEEDCRQISFELRKEKDSRDADAEKFSAIENKLRGEINDIIHNCEQAASIIEHDANQLEFSCLTAYEEMQGRLEDSIATLQARLDNNSNIETAQILRKKNKKVSSELNIRISRYDDNMLRLQNELMYISLRAAEEKDKFEQLSNYFSKIDEDQRIADAENLIIQDKRDKEEAEVNRLQASAIVIQSRFRGYQTRERLRRKKTKKKKKRK